jgi:hypothetical protein
LITERRGALGEPSGGQGHHVPPLLDYRFRLFVAEGELTEGLRVDLYR